MVDMQAFDPVRYSKEENQWLLENLGKPPVVALKSVPFPVNKAAVGPIMEKVQELEQQKEHEGIEWAGIDALKKAISVYLEQDAKWERDFTRTKGRAPRFPSLYSYDAKGKPHWSGPGSDSGKVRTYFGPAGERIPFEIDLVPEHNLEWLSPGFTEKPVESELKIDSESHRIECHVKVGAEGVERACGHTESYKADSRSSYTAARARMSKHLRKATENPDGHREVYTNEFGS